MIRQQTRLKPRSLTESDRHLFELCKPLHPVPIAGLDRRAIAARLTAIATANGPAAANRVRGTLGAFFTWAIREGLLETNPTSLTNKARENGPRDRVLSGAELAVIWQAAGDDPYGAVVKLLILTGQRRGEIGDLCWSEVDLDTDCINLPAARSKNGRPHWIALSEPVRALLEIQPRRDGRDRVFGSLLWNQFKIALDKRVADANGKPLPPWVLHDLRRTFSTGLHELGTPPHVVETMLNHVTGHRSGVASVYNRARYEDECRRAWHRWASHVLSIVTGERATAQVVQLKCNVI